MSDTSNDKQRDARNLANQIERVKCLIASSEGGEGALNERELQLIVQALRTFNEFRALCDLALSAQSAAGPINNDLTQLIDRMHDAILDTDASSRPAGNLFDVWWALKGFLENRVVSSASAARTCPWATYGSALCRFGLDAEIDGKWKPIIDPADSGNADNTGHKNTIK